ncbi:hypothetical protein BDY19DRAFT_993308 [Irpex rosettiformis]|uniref:Uncharacterized protein n=1 Tax=Irpex rosettiformis TaxID=378272 RepID=A0ACB8U4B6_9APHY|nr:hypothetical protein BDY19DRAFT_993308 [Irpex rosettiformis]
MHAEHAFLLVAGQPTQVSDFAFSLAQTNLDDGSGWLNGVEEHSKTLEHAASAHKHSSHASVRGDTKGGCSLDTEDRQLSRNPTAATAVTTARESHDRHAHAYRQTHEGREQASVSVLERHGPCIMDGQSIQSGIELEGAFDFEDLRFNSIYTEGHATRMPEDRIVDEELRSFILDKKSIILDSPFPELAPHIAITPPHDLWEGCMAHAWNSPLPQDEKLLAVPLQYTATEYYPSYGLIEHYGQPPEHESSVVERPRLRPSRFTVSSHVAEDQELSYSLLRLYKMAARTAMLIAPNFRKRWDTPSFAQTCEKPFIWSDPASPLLEFYGLCRDTRIIDSLHPFTAPHIIIHESPDQTPWDACVNRVVPQYCAYLMVPGVPCHCPVPADDISSSDESIHMEEVTDSQGQQTACFTAIHFEQGVEPDEMDEQETDMLSPSDDSDSNSDFWPDTPKDDVFRFTITSDLPLSYSSTPSYPLPSDPSEIEQSYGSLPNVGYGEKFRHDYALDEDEDELPPFDEWYQDIADRSAAG